MKANSKITWSKKDILWMTILSLLYILCFPINPLVLLGVIDVESPPELYIIGWAIWTFGMVLVMAPIVMFPRRGGVPKGKSFVKTTQLVDTGIYGVIRHPQYTGGIYAVFIPTLLWYPHWLFAVLGFFGALLTYLSIIEEDKRLIEKFGDEYSAYMRRVPRMNFILGIFRLLKHRNE